jgi:ribosomal protein L37E
VTQVMRNSSISRIVRGRIIGSHTSTKETVLSSSSGDTTEWRGMSQDSRSKCGHRTFKHITVTCDYCGGYTEQLQRISYHWFDWLKLKEVFPSTLEEDARGTFRTREVGL